MGTEGNRSDTCEPRSANGIKGQSSRGVRALRRRVIYSRETFSTLSSATGRGRTINLRVILRTFPGERSAKLARQSHEWNCSSAINHARFGTCKSCELSFAS